MADKPDWSAVQQSLLLKQVVNNGFVTIDVSQYNSVIISTLSPLSSSTIALVYGFQQLDGTATDAGLLSANSLDGQPSWALPVSGPILIIQNNRAVDIQVSVYGNTAPSKKIMLNSAFPDRTFSTTVPNGTASGTFTQQAGLDSPPGGTSNSTSNYNGLVYIHLSLSALGGATSWQLIASFVDATGTVVPRQLWIGTALETTMLVGHPFAYVTWTLRNIGVLTAAVTPTINLYPAEIS